MHQSFVTMALKGPVNIGLYFDFTLCKAQVYAQYCGDTFMVKVLPKALPKSQQVHVKLLWPVTVWNQKPHSSTALQGQWWAQNMALKPRCPYHPRSHMGWAYKWLVYFSEKQMKWALDDNSAIIFHISPQINMFWVQIRIASARWF